MRLVHTEALVKDFARNQQITTLLTMDKSTIRSTLIARRKAMARDAKVRANKRIRERITGLDAWKKAATLMLYLPVNGEVNTWPLFDDCLDRKCRVLLPCCRKDEPGCMDFYSVGSNKQLIQGSYNIPEPDRNQCTFMDDPKAEIILVPGVGFDRQGHRIGYGGGYYDRFLADHPMDDALVIGLAFACQIMDHLPHDPWDQRVDVIVTEDEMIWM